MTGISHFLYPEAGGRYGCLAAATTAYSEDTGVVNVKYGGDMSEEARVTVGVPAADRPAGLSVES
jgi:hypothetical protein